jgi:sec-independent protein translocase protein TatB
MFNIGGGEFLVIALIALIVLGPQRLPEAARQVGKAMGDLRRMSSGFQEELRGALDVTEPSPASTPSTPARDVLGAGSDARSAAAAAPAPDPTAKAARPARKAPLKAAPVPKAPRPRSKGS